MTFGGRGETATAGRLNEAVGELLRAWDGEDVARRLWRRDGSLWAASGKPLTVLVPELDDYLRPDEARQRFARVPKADLVGVPGAKHLWVGESYVRIVMNEIVRRMNPRALIPPAMTLPTDLNDP